MRHRNSQTADGGSLDLLLDTICNTFGGVLFISLLVVILTNMTAEQVSMEPPEQASQSSLIALRRDLESAKDELQRLQTSVSQQQCIQTEFTSDESIRLAQQLRDSRTRVAGTIASNDALLSKIGQSQTQINQAAKKLTALTANLKQARAELAKITLRLTMEVKSRTKTATLPTVTGWNGEVANLFLKQGHLCALQIVQNGFLTWNTQESKRSTRNGVTVIDPIVSAGLPITLKPPDTAAIRGKLSGYDPQQHLIRVWVTPESFEHFSLIREALVKRKFHYEVVPVSVDQHLSVGSSQTQHRAQ